MKTHIPAWLLERYALGELSAARMEEVRRILDADPEQRARLQALREDDAAILAERPPAAFAEAVLRRASAAPPAANNRAWYAVAPALVLAAVAAMYVSVGPQVAEGPVGEEIEITRTKGLAPQLVVLRKQDGDPERLDDGDLARAGDVLQLRYVAGGDRYGVVVSVDGRGNSTVHLAEGPRAAALDPDGAVALPSAFELDDAPRFERFFLVSGAEPFEVGPIVAAAEGAASGPDASLPVADLHVTAFTVRKP